MFRNNYYVKFARHFFALKVTRKKYVAHLVVSAILRTLSFLLIPLMAAEIVEGLERQDFQYAFVAIGLFLASAILYVTCHHYNFWAYYINANSIHNVLQRKILKKVTEFDTSFSSDISKSALVSTAFRDVDHARMVPDQMCDALVNMFGIVVSVVILCVVDWRIGLVAAVLLVFSTWDFVRHTKKRDRSLATMYEHSDELTGLYAQMIDGYKEVQALNLQENLAGYLEKSKVAWSKSHRTQRFHRDFASAIAPLFLNVGRTLIYLILAGQILSGGYDVSVLVLVVGYYEDMINRYDKICGNIDNISRSYVAIERLYRLLRYKTPQMVEFGKDRTDDILGVVEFSKVNFDYEEMPKKSLDGTALEAPAQKYPGMKNVSFVAMPRNLTAIVGKSGSGKSTIFRLLLRFYKINSGRIMIDGKDIYDYTEKVYANNVSLVAQKPFVFDMTIRENLSLVDSNRERQIEACKKVGVHNDIMKLEKGYDTVLEKDGENLSAGQKQLLTFARTLLSKSEILLLDEVTSSLDGVTTEKVVEVMKKLKKDHTVLMITHKPDLMRMADKIIVVDKGRVVGEGTHRELMRDNEIYQSLQKIYER